MPYEGRIFRPPSEADSLILQVTVGCSHNTCTFCESFKEKKFREKSMEEIKEIIAFSCSMWKNANRIFLADGDALAMSSQKLLFILNMLYKCFPRLERVSTYGGPRNILDKTPEELKQLSAAGLSMVYLGVESGDAQILREVRKGATPEDMIVAGKLVKEAGMQLSVTIIAGLGGKARWREHAINTAQILNLINPHYLGVLTLMVVEGTPMAKKVAEGKFNLLSSFEILEEIKLLVERLQTTNCIFRSNHASNYLALKGTLAEDKEKVLGSINEVLSYKSQHLLRPEEWRRL